MMFCASHRLNIKRKELSSGDGNANKYEIPMENVDTVRCALLVIAGLYAA